MAMNSFQAKIFQNAFDLIVHFDKPTQCDLRQIEAFLLANPEWTPDTAWNKVINSVSSKLGEVRKYKSIGKDGMDNKAILANIRASDEIVRELDGNLIFGRRR